jgi:serine/threonine protein kinase
MACDLELPSGGSAWHALRDGNIPFHEFVPIDKDLRDIITLMMNRDPSKRPTAAELLEHQVIAKVARKRRIKIKRLQIYDQLQKYFYWVICLFNIRKLLLFFSASAESSNCTPEQTLSSQLIPETCNEELRFSTAMSSWNQSCSDDEDWSKPSITHGVASPALGESKAYDDGASFFSAAHSSSRLKSLRTRTQLSQVRHTPLNCVSKTPQRTFTSSLHHDSTFASRTSYLNSSLCEFSDNENDDESSAEMPVGPKNLLTVFENMGSEDDDD